MRVASAGFGFVTFDKPGPAEEVCKRQDHIINGKAVCDPPTRMVPWWCGVVLLQLQARCIEPVA